MAKKYQNMLKGLNFNRIPSVHTGKRFYGIIHTESGTILLTEGEFARFRKRAQEEGYD